MFFVSSKIFGLFIHPLTIVIILIFVGWLLLFKKIKMGRSFIGFGLLLLLLFSWGPFSGFLIMPLEDRFPNLRIPKRIAGVIVLAGGFAVSEGGEMQLGSLNRVIRGILLIRQHPEAFLVFSGGSGSIVDQTHREATDMKDLAVRLGVPADRILVELNSRNTHENAIEAVNLLKKYMEKESKERWVLITSAFHMPRAIGCFTKAGIDPIPHSVDYMHHEENNFISLPAPENLITVRSAIKEWIGLIAYRFMGYTSEIFPSSNTIRSSI